MRLIAINRIEALAQRVQPEPLIRASRTFSPRAGRRVSTSAAAISLAPRRGERVAGGRVRGVVAHLHHQQLVDRLGGDLDRAAFWPRGDLQFKHRGSIVVTTLSRSP